MLCLVPHALLSISRLQSYIVISSCRLRNARPNHQPSALPADLTVLCKVLVACVIALGPFIGIAAAAMLGAKPGDQVLLAQATHLRKASATVRAQSG